MYFRKGSEALRHENSSACVAYEYQLPTSELDSAVIELSGRYPEKGWALNTSCTSLIYVIKGAGWVISEEARTKVSEGHQVLIEKGEKYALHGDMKLLFSAAPAWSPDQARKVDP